MGFSKEFEGEDAGTASVRTTDSVAAGAGRLCADVSTEVEVIIMGAGAITRFPLLNTDIATHAEVQLLCAEVRMGDGGSTVIIAKAVLVQDMNTRTVHLGGAQCSIYLCGDT